MKLIVGLGNPELKYFYTRHNTGFLAIDELLNRNGGLKLDNEKFRGVFTKTKLEGEDVIISKPLTYMNLSGEFVRPLADFYKIDYSDIIVVYDELALPVGRIKISKDGSSAGHNGIKSIISNLSTDKFIRVRIGIAIENSRVPQIDYVLMKYSKEELVEQEKNIKRAVDAITSIIKDGLEKSMNEFNR